MLPHQLVQCSVRNLLMPTRIHIQRSPVYKFVNGRHCSFDSWGTHVVHVLQPLDLCSKASSSCWIVDKCFNQQLIRVPAQIHIFEHPCDGMDGMQSCSRFHVCTYYARFNISGLSEIYCTYVLAIGHPTTRAVCYMNGVPQLVLLNQHCPLAYAVLLSYTDLPPPPMCLRRRRRWECLSTI